MKHRDLLDSLGMIDPAFIEEAAPGNLPTPSARKVGRVVHIRWRNWIPAVAAMLAVAILVGALVGGVPGILSANPSGSEGEQETGAPVASVPLCLASPLYPTMAQYPKNTGSLNTTDHSGSFVLSADYQAWMTALQIRVEYFGAGTPLKAFFARTIACFLGNAGTENAAFSPLNVYMGLAILAEISAGETREQILTLLGSPSIESLRAQASTIWNADYRDDGLATSVLANSLWMSDSLECEGDTAQNLAQYYYASSYQGTMGSAAFNQLLQDWVKAHTANGSVSGLDAPQTDEAAMLSLFSTVLYENGWRNGFNEKETMQLPFNGANGAKKCDMMYDSTPRTYWKGDGFSSVSLFLTDGRMDVILPDRGMDVDALLQDADVLAYLVDGTKGVTRGGVVEGLFLPRFELQSRMDLTEGLKELGITHCFDGNAELSALTSSGQTVFLNSMQHEVRIEVNEERSEAYLNGGQESSNGSSGASSVFMVNRPFIFVIRNAEGLPLFVGVVNQING